jgi:hypothetical protein
LKVKKPAKSSASWASIANRIAVGHQPATALSPQDETLFKAFQANLLSLISHELRTPLTGILNALGVLEDGGGMGEFTSEELIRMARQNAQRLHRALLTLLDMAALESGTFHVRLREVEFEKLARARLEAHDPLLKDRELKLEASFTPGSAVLADPQKLARAIDLCLQAMIPRVQANSAIRADARPHELELSFKLGEGMEEAWKAAWSQAEAGFQGGVASPTSAFSGVLQSEQAFLSRVEEGLGSEFLLIHEILRQHQGRFKALQKGSVATLTLELPSLSSEGSLRAVLSSRAYDASTELRSVTLGLLEIPQSLRSKAELEAFARQVKSCLFRASDAVYPLPELRLVALVLDDCRPGYVPVLFARVGQAIGSRPVTGVAHCPADGLDPERLIEVARRRLASAARG